MPGAANSLLVKMCEVARSDAEHWHPYKYARGPLSRWPWRNGVAWPCRSQAWKRRAFFGIWHSGGVVTCCPQPRARRWAKKPEEAADATASCISLAANEKMCMEMLACVSFLGLLVRSRPRPVVLVLCELKTRARAGQTSSRKQQERGRFEEGPENQSQGDIEVDVWLIEASSRQLPRRPHAYYFPGKPGTLLKSGLFFSGVQVVWWSPRPLSTSSASPCPRLGKIFNRWSATSRREREERERVCVRERQTSDEQRAERKRQQGAPARSLVRMHRHIAYFVSASPRSEGEGVTH